MNEVHGWRLSSGGMFVTGEKVTLDYDDRYDHLFSGRQAWRSLGFLCFFIFLFFSSFKYAMDSFVGKAGREAGRQGSSKQSVYWVVRIPGVSLLFPFLLFIFSSFLCFTLFTKPVTVL